MVDAPNIPSLGDAIGPALGGLFGGLSSLASTQAGISAVGQMTDVGAAQVAPYNFTGANYLGPVAQNLVGGGAGAQNIGNARINDPTNPVDFENFAQNYNTSQGAQYLMRTAAAAQNDTAAARGGLLSGANLRAQTTMTEDIANQDMLGQYKSMLSGQQQDFQQRETSYQNMYGQEAMGLQAGIAEAGTYAQGARAIGSLYATQAQQTGAAASSFGSALGGVFKAIGGLFGSGAAAAAL
jgi:hypothetical protein